MNLESYPMDHPGNLPPQLSVYQPPATIVIPQIDQRARVSCGLIAFGIIQFLLSCGTIGLSAWIINLANFPLFADVSLGCGVFFMLMSFAGMYGGNDIKRRQYSIIWCMVFGILGLITMTISIISTLMSLTSFPKQCSLCKVEVSSTGVNAGCSAMCYIAYEPVHVVLVLLAGIEGLVGLIMSCAACCNVCKCCCCYPEDATPGGFVIQQPTSVVRMNAFGSEVPYRPLQM